jgi:carbon starvation protein CstA
MTDSQVAQPGARSSPEQKKNWKARAIIAVIAVAVLVAAVLIAASALPRWWSQRAGDQVDGDLTTGLWVGFMYGFLATLLPLLVLGVVYRFFRRSWLAWVIGGAIALVLAAPNLLTLGIAVGTSDAAHAADRTLDVEAPWFRGGMVIGVVVGLAVAGFLLYVIVSRRRARDHAERMRAELRAAKSAESPPPAV